MDSTDNQQIHPRISGKVWGFGENESALGSEKSPQKLNGALGPRGPQEKS